MKFRQRTAVLFIIAIGLLLYQQVIFNKFILGDDEDQILNNVQVHSLSNIPRFFFESTYYIQQAQYSYGLFYRPLMVTSYALLYAGFGPNPAIFHLFQELFHIANAIIVFFILVSFFPEFMAFLVALLFLVHPINSETVVQAANLQDVLFFFFGGIAFLLISKNKEKEISNKRLFVFSLFFLLSLLSKETGILFGVILLCYLFLFNKRNLWKLSYYVFGVALCYGLFRFFIAKVGIGQSILSPIAQSSLSTRLLTLPSIFLKYLTTFLFPRNLETAQFWIITKADVMNFFLPLSIVIVLFIASIVIGKMLAKKNKKLFLTYAFFYGWFLLGIVPHLQIMPLDVTLAERWFYFPIVGLLGMLFTIYTAFFLKKKRVNRVALIGCLILIVLLSLRTYSRILDWRDSETLFVHDLQVSPHNYLIENNLGNLYMDHGEYTKAKPYMLDSVKQYPYIDNLNNVAILYAHDKNIKEAKKYFVLAMHQGGSYTVYKNYAYFLLLYAKEYREALRIASIGLLHYHEGSELYLAKALAEYQLGDYRTAQKDAKHSYQLFPSQKSNKIYQLIRTRQKMQLEKLQSL